MNRTVFQWGTSLAPLIVALLLELQRQADTQGIDGWSFLSVATGALATLVMTVFQTVRADTEDELEIKGSGR